ncbi:MAG: FGGY family carbohydrate kinase [Anaerolineae bacterium]
MMPEAAHPDRHTPLFLALDAGTSGGRAVIIDAAGVQRAEAIRPWGYFAPEDAAPWGREFDPAAFWSLLCDAARETLACVDAAAVVAVTATGQRQATVLVDDDGHELYGGPNFDVRAGFEGMGLLRQHGPLLHRITGHLPPMMFAGARWLWFRQHRPDVVARTAHLLMMADWVNWRLCGDACTDPTNAAETGLYDVAHHLWSAELLSLLHVPAAVLPPVQESGSIAGRLSAHAATQLGLPPGLPVAVAASDTACGILGMGVTRPGAAGIICGWSAPAQVLTEGPVFDSERSLWTTCSPLPGHWALEGNCGMAGAAHRWLRDVLAPAGGFEEIEALAAGVAPGCGGALAFLGPRVADYDNPQLLWGGFLLPQANDLLPIGRAELARATFENIAFAIRANWDRMQAVVATDGADAIRIGGGLTRSSTFIDILANVLPRPLQVAVVPSVSALGAAACAATAVGLQPDLATAAAAMAPCLAAVPTRRLVQAEYLDSYERWLHAYRGLRSLSAEML